MAFEERTTDLITRAGLAALEEGFHPHLDPGLLQVVLTTNMNQLCLTADQLQPRCFR